MNLTELLEQKTSVTGYELNCIVMDGLYSNNPQENAIASDLYIALFSPDVEQHPLKFVYYSIAFNRKKGKYVAYRDLNMSPRANQYFGAECLEDKLGTIIRDHCSVTGAELINCVNEAKCRDYLPKTLEDSGKDLEASFLNLSKQFAEYIDKYFIDCDKPIKGDIYYTIVVKEYGTATLYRDLTKSPRTANK